MIKCVLLCLCATFMLAARAEVSASRLDALITQLTEDDFDTREAASAELADWPAQYAKEFRARAIATTDPEIKDRLFKASRLVWERKILPQSERWQRLNGTLNLSLSLQWKEAPWEYWRERAEWEMERRRAEEAGEKLPPEPKYRENDVVGLRVESVDSVDSPVVDLLDAGDLITEINDVEAKEVYKDPLYEWGIFIAGHTYKLKVKRTQLTAEAKKIAEDTRKKGEDVNEGDLEHEVIEKTIEVTAVIENEYHLNFIGIRNVTNEEWDKFIAEYEKPTGK